MSGFRVSIANTFISIPATRTLEYKELKLQAAMSGPSRPLFHSKHGVKKVCWKDEGRACKLKILKQFEPVIGKPFIFRGWGRGGVIKGVVLLSTMEKKILFFFS